MWLRQDGDCNLLQGGGGEGQQARIEAAAAAAAAAAARSSWAKQEERRDEKRRERDEMRLACGRTQKTTVDNRETQHAGRLHELGSNKLMLSGRVRGGVALWTQQVLWLVTTKLFFAL